MTSAPIDMMSKPSQPRRIISDELLQTKIVPPRLGPSLVSRAPLLARLNAGLARKLTLVAAPAGSGKTTLIAEWIQTLTPAPLSRYAGEGTDMRVAWVSLDASDDDPIRFWRYIIAACQALNGELGRSALAALRTAQQPSLESTLTPFINELAQLPERDILVLDDYHVITSPQIHETMSFLLDHFPASLHLVLITRSEPPLPLARWRAHNELSELTTADLRFSSAEIKTFFEQTLRLPLSTDALARLEARTEGWATGLRLVALALEGRSGPAAAEQFLATFTGSDRFILDYLVAEVLGDQPESVQEFLLQTSLLGRLTPSLCDAVTDRNDSALVLDQLARANLFLTPLSDSGSRAWYRHHTLFAEALQHMAQQRFGESGLQVLHDKAAHWYEAHRFLTEAVEASIAARAFERAALLIERLLEERSLTELYTLRRWAEQLPGDVLDAHPIVSFDYARAILFTSDRFAPATAASVEVPLQAAEQVWRMTQNGEGLGQVLALRSLVALWHEELTQAFANAREALELLPDDETNWRGISLITIGIEEWLIGHVDAAQRTLMEARALCEAAQSIYSASPAMIMLGEVCIRQAELDQAAQLFQQVLTEIGDTAGMDDDRMHAEIGLGLVAFERNDLTLAEAHATRALEIGQRYSAEELDMRASLLLARIQRARGQIAAAQGKWQVLMAKLKRPRLLREVHAWQARFALATGDLTAVQRWQDAYTQRDHDMPPLLQEIEAFTLARLHLAEARPAAALELLDRWRLDARRHGRGQSELESLCLMALAYFDQSDLEQARKTIIRALTIAQPRGCQRVFLDEGENMARLLQTVLPDVGKRPLAVFATILLRAFATTRSTQPASERPSSPLFEPLSPQEQRVLRLLAAGLSNPEIARELVVSTNTIKTQVQSIYRKLNVTTRADAAEIARQLKLA